jgi:flagellar basal body-associated protein FliL
MTDEFDLNEKNIQYQNTVPVENKAELDKDDNADEFLNSLKEIIGYSENKAGEEPDFNIKSDTETKADPEPENKKEKKKSSQDEVEQDESDDESLQTTMQKFIARIKQFSPVKIRIIVSSVTVVLLFCMGILFFILFSGGDQKKSEVLFADSVPVSEIKEPDNILMIENYEMKTFVIPMKDSARDRVFFKADFIIMIDKVDLIQLKNNNVKIREAVYNLFNNKDSEIISKKLKRSELLYKLKNVLDLIFKKEIIKGIEMVNYKVV